MLLSFGAKNFSCFKEWVEIDLTTKKIPPTDISHDEGTFFAVCFKGANASGKTNALKILAFLSAFCADSFTSWKPEEKILVDSFFGNTEPVEVYANFLINGIEYNYEAALTREEVISEKIYKKVKRRGLVLSREYDRLKVNRLAKDVPIKLRKNSSIIGTAYQYQVPEFQPIYNFFHSIFSNVAYFGFRQASMLRKSITDLYSIESEAFEFTTDLLKKFDVGIESIKIVERNIGGRKALDTIFEHHNNKQSYNIALDFESSGTKALYTFLYLYKKALESGGILILDEFDANIHPDILPLLVELFDNPKSNPLGAQFLYSTHNNDIMEYMGKYRTYLFNKDDNESYCYRVDELKNIRNDRPILPLYRMKKLGGVPKL
jgi:AAA15 family ATPase/GTPase